MPQIAHTKSIAFTHTCVNGEANLEILTPTITQSLLLMLSTLM